MEWKHPTGKAPKSVVLVCLGASHQDYISDAINRDPPDWMLSTDEIWTLNRGALAFRHDLAFVMDYLDGEAAHYPRYATMLRRSSSPIITSIAGSHWPKHISEYPIKEIWNWLMSDIKPHHQEWLINSVPLILVYAAFIGVKTMHIYGADYQGHSQAEDGAACLSYWIGVMEHRLVVKVPVTTQLLGANNRFIYGYPPDLDPRPDAVARRQLFQELIAHA